MYRHAAAISFLIFNIFSITSFAQSVNAPKTVPPAATQAHRGNAHVVDPFVRYTRLICLVHLTGSGKHGDPIRPEYAPLAADTARQGIIAWSFELTDDKSMAILHVAATNSEALAPILADVRPDVKVFQLGKDSRAAIEAEMQKHKKDFNLDNFRVVAR